MRKYRLGIDIGGTKLRIVALDGHRVILAQQVPTPSTTEELYKSLGLLYRRAVASINNAEHTLGIGMPGNVNRPTWVTKSDNFKAELEQALEHPIAVENDANCFALAEMTLGAGYGLTTGVGIILGTGVGSGIVVGGRIQGSHGLGGEWGHVPLDIKGHECWCGRRGCYERYISGRAVEKQYYEAQGEHELATSILEMNNSLPAELIKYEFYRNLAHGLAMLTNIVDPEIIILGGSVSSAPSIYTHVPPLVKNLIFNTDLQTRIVPAILDKDSGAIGAALIGI